MKFVKDLKRTHYCGDIRASHNGQKVILMGWVDTRRDHGGLVFVDLRDRSGLAQVVLNPAEAPTKQSKDFRNEFVVAIEGEVRMRPEGMTNKKLETGEVEVVALRCEILSEANTPPFQLDDENVTEVLRLKYRYMDIRTKKLQGYLKTRHNITQTTRKYLGDNGFLEIETPILYKSTPEGARDYLVPSRVNLGHFYALPQSPQTLKQLLMIGGVDRYFQVARCFRDEDLRADRQPEFSQIDIEMSFIDEDDVMASTEGLAKAIWKEVKGVEINDFPVLTYQEAMDDYGSDKPDIRIPWKLKDITESLKDCGFKVFDDVASRGDSIKGLAIPGMGQASRGKFDKLTTMAKQVGAKGLVWIKCNDEGELTSPISKFFDDSKFKSIYESCGGEKGGAVLIVADEFEITCHALGLLRTHLAQELKAIDDKTDRFLWVKDFPLLEYDPNGKRWAAKHHPFTQVNDDDIEKLLNGEEKEFSHIKAKAYDLVCNGHEIAGGSVRIHRQDVQNAMFTALGMDEQEIKEKFGFFIEALSYGTPPHGGIAWGLDRITMILCGTDAIRDVIAFPKTAKATCLMSNAPGTVAREQLVELGVRLSGAAEKNLKEED